MSSSPDITEQEIRERCHGLLNAAADEAARLHHDYIGVEHLYIALTQTEGGIAQRLLFAVGLDPRTVRNEIRRETGANDADSAYTFEEMPFTPRAYRVLTTAVYIADDHGEDTILELHLLMSILREGESIPIRKLQALGVDISAWIELLVDELTYHGDDDMLFSGGLRDESFQQSVESDAHERSETRLTPLLDKYGRDLTELARQGKINPVIGREREIRAVARTLTRSKKNNPLLLGDSGVGKTAVVEGSGL